MTDLPVSGHDSHLGIDNDYTSALRRKMVDGLVDDGELADERWCEAFLAVPRHVLVPRYYQAAEYLDGESDPDRWLRLVYSDTTLITQRSPAAITSSGTMPSLLAAMLHALDVEDGHRVLQVGTGTGYTAALLCARLGSAQVTSVDVDPDLTGAARDRLRRCGYTPILVTADGAHGHYGGAPYDRIIATFSVTAIPPAWIAQTCTAGVVVAPVLSGLARLVVTGEGTAQGRFIGPGYFMRHRPSPGPQPDTEPTAAATEPRWPDRSSTLPSGVYYDTDFRFFLDLAMPRLAHGHPTGNRDELILTAPDGSHAHLAPDGRLAQTGPRALWDTVESLHHTWRSVGSPPRERFGLTVTPQHQTIWLDTPDDPHQWPLR